MVVEEINQTGGFKRIGTNEIMAIVVVIGLVSLVGKQTIKKLIKDYKEIKDDVYLDEEKKDKTK